MKSIILAVLLSTSIAFAQDQSSGKSGDINNMRCMRAKTCKRSQQTKEDTTPKVAASSDPLRIEGNPLAAFFLFASVGGFIVAGIMYAVIKARSK